MAAHTSPDQRAGRLASRQHAAISHHQAVACGLSDDAIANRIARGLWRRVARGVYVIVGAPDTWQQRAMVAQLANERSDGLLSHTTAGSILGVMPRAWVLPWVTVAPGSSARSTVAKVCRSPVPAIDRCRIDGFVLTNVNRTICDLAGILDRPTLAEVVDVAFCGGKATRDSVLSAADRAGKGQKGRVLLREELEVWTPEIQPDSPAEMRLLRQLRELGVDGIETQYKVFDEAGGFVARLDLAVPAWRSGLEYDSVLFHNPRHWERDEPRYQRVHAAGWDVEGVTKYDLLPGVPRLPQLVDRWQRRGEIVRVDPHRAR